MKSPLAVAISAVLLCACSDSNDGATPSSGPAEPSVQRPVVAGRTSITIDNAEAVLRDVIRFVNEEPFRAVLTAARIADAELTETSPPSEVGAGSVPALPARIGGGGRSDGSLSDPVTRSEFACAGGGLLEVFAGEFPSGTIRVHTGCTSAGTTLEGNLFRSSSPVRPRFDTVSAGELVAASSDGATTRTLVDGFFTANGTSFVTASAERSAVQVDYRESVDGSSVRIDDFSASLSYEAPAGRSGGGVPAVAADGAEIATYPQNVASSLRANFRITADWSGGAPASVSVALEHDDGYVYFDGWRDGITAEDVALTDAMGAPLQLDLERDAFFYWKRGALSVTAADGSVLTLSPDTPTTWRATLGDEVLTIERDAPGMEVDCAPIGIGVEDFLPEIDDCSLGTQSLDTP